MYKKIIKISKIIKLQNILIICYSFFYILKVYINLSKMYDTNLS